MWNANLSVPIAASCFWRYCPKQKNRNSITRVLLTLSSVQFSLVQFSSVQDGIYALEKAHMHSTPSLGSFPKVAVEIVPMLVWDARFGCFICSVIIGDYHTLESGLAAIRTQTFHRWHVFVLVPYQLTTYYSSVLSQQHYLRKMGMTLLHVIV